MVRCGGCGQQVNNCKNHPNIEIDEDDRVPSSWYYICVGDGYPHWAICPKSSKEYPWHYITYSLE